MLNRYRMNKWKQILHPEIPTAKPLEKIEPARVYNYGNQGHGHVTPRPDGIKARCGGPSMCTQCAIDQGKLLNSFGDC